MERTARRCLRCPQTTSALHGLCPDCIAADVTATRTAQGLPPVVPPDADVFAQLDVLTRPTAPERAA